MFTIVQYPHPALRKKARPVTEFTSEILEFGQELLKTLVPRRGKPLGVGLASNQVNKLYRIFVVKMPEGRYEIVVNPKIVKASSKTLSSLPQKARFLEGCLRSEEHTSELQS